MRLRELSKLIAGRKLSGLNPDLQDVIISKLKDYVPDNRRHALMIGNVTGYELVAFVAESPTHIANEAFDLAIVDDRDTERLLADIKAYDQLEDTEEDLRNHHISTTIFAIAVVCFLGLILSHVFIKLNSSNLPKIPEDQVMATVGKVLELSLSDKVHVEVKDEAKEKPEEVPVVSDGVSEEQLSSVDNEDAVVDVTKLTDQEIQELLEKTKSKPEDYIEYPNY